MRTTLSSVVTLFLLASPGFAAEPVPGLAKVGTDGQLHLRIIHSVMVCEPMTYTVNRDAVSTRSINKGGKVVTETVTEKVPEAHTKVVCRAIGRFQERKVAAAAISARTVDGKSVDSQNLALLLKSEVPVLITSDKVSDYCLPVYKPGTLILTVPLVPQYGVSPEPRRMPTAAEAPAPGPQKIAPPVAQAIPIPLPKPAVAVKAEPGKPSPPGAPPMVAFASLDDKGNLRLRVISEQSSTMTDYVDVTVDGKQQTRPISINAFTYTSSSRETRAESVKVVGLTGKTIPNITETLRKKPETLVLSTSDSRPLDSLYLSLYRPEALVVLFPGSPFAECPPAPLPPPGPAPALPLGT